MKYLLSTSPEPYVSHNALYKNCKNSYDTLNKMSARYKNINFFKQCILNHIAAQIQMFLAIPTKKIAQIVLLRISKKATGAIISINIFLGSAVAQW